MVLHGGTAPSGSTRDSSSSSLLPHPIKKLGAGEWLSAEESVTAWASRFPMPIQVATQWTGPGDGSSRDLVELMSTCRSEFEH